MIRLLASEFEPERDVTAQRQLDDHPLERGRDDDHHLRALVRPPLGQARRRPPCRRCWSPRPRQGLHAPGPHGDLRGHLVGQLADGPASASAGPSRCRGPRRARRSPPRRRRPCQLDGPGIDLVATAGVDGQLERDSPATPEVVDLGDEPGLVALGERGGDLEVDEEVLADRQRRRSSGRPAYRPR